MDVGEGGEMLVNGNLIFMHELTGGGGGGGGCRALKCSNADKIVTTFPQM